MTKLCEMIMECRAIKGMDRLVLYGWASQLEEGNDTLYCSKETVAEAIGVSDDTVLRRTQALVDGGWLIDTGEQKQWKFGWTPVRIVNVPVIVGLVEAQCRKLRRVADCTPPQNAAQGSGCSGLSGFRSSGLSGSPSFFPSGGTATPTTTGVPPVVVTAPVKTEEEPENLTPRTCKPENLEPTPTPVSTVIANGGNAVRACPRCKEPWSRDRNHICKVMDKRSPLDDRMDDPMYISPLDKRSPLVNWDEDDFPVHYGEGKNIPTNPDGSIDLSRWDYGQKDFGKEPMAKKAEGARQSGEAVGQKGGEGIFEEGRTTATAAPLHDSPRSAAPPRKRCSACGGVEPCRDKWCYAYEPFPKADEIRPKSINL
jgi:hypothetical protein